MEKIIKWIDWLNEKIGFVSSFIILPLIFIVAYEVFRRYVLNSPTSWGFELTTYLYGIHFMLGAGYTYLYDGHVAIDVVVERLSENWKLKLRILTFLTMFLPFVGIITYESIKFAIASWQIKEHSWTAWRPPVYPIKTFMAIGFILLFLEGVSKFLKDIKDLRKIKEKESCN